MTSKTIITSAYAKSVGSSNDLNIYERLRYDLFQWRGLIPERHPLVMCKDNESNSDAFCVNNLSTSINIFPFASKQLHF